MPTSDVKTRVDGNDILVNERGTSWFLLPSRWAAMLSDGDLRPLASLQAPGKVGRGVPSTNAHPYWGLLFSFPRALAFGPLLFTFPGSYLESTSFRGPSTV